MSVPIYPKRLDPKRPDPDRPITIETHHRDKQVGIIARFRVYPDPSSQSENFRFVTVERRPRGLGLGPAHRWQSEELRLTGPLLAWCEANRAFVRVSWPRQSAHRRAIIAVWNRPELAVEFRMRFL